MLPTLAPLRDEEIEQDVQLITLCTHSTEDPYTAIAIFLVAAEDTPVTLINGHLGLVHDIVIDAPSLDNRLQIATMCCVVATLHEGDS